MTNRSLNQNFETTKDVYNVHVQELIKDVLSKAALGKARNHFFHDKNDDFKQSVNNLAATLTVIGLAGKVTDDIVVESNNRRSSVSARYKVSDYQVPTNIALFDVLNLGEFYTSVKMRERNKSIGKLESDYTLIPGSRVLSPDEVRNVYTLLEMTSNSGWDFGNLTKPSLLINELSVVRGKEGSSPESEFYIVDGDGESLSIEVLLATGLTFEDDEFPVKNFYPDEVYFNDSYYQLVENLAINNSVAKNINTRKDDGNEESEKQSEK